MSKSNKTKPFIPFVSSPIRFNDPVNDLSEDIQNQFDNQPGGGIFDVTETGEKATKDTDNDGQAEEFNNKYLEGDTARSIYDYIFDYDTTLNDKEDTEDVFGPTLGEAAEGEVSNKFTIVVVLAGIIAVFIVFRPLITAIGSIIG
jgi:hypothetical protein